MNDEADDLDAYLARRLEETTEDLDIYTQLANKEKDLTLAAELGKALLEKNDELERLNAQLHDEYQMKLEQLEQEKHDYKHRLEAAERHYEMMVKELQADVNMYKQEAENKESCMKIGERERLQVVAELTKQNEKQSEQIRKAEEMVDELSRQNDSLREQIRARQTTTQTNQAHQDMLRDEIYRLTEEQDELERRFRELTDERDALTASLDESQQRIHMLEKQKQEKEADIRAKDQQILELKDSNVVLEERLEDVYLQVSSGEFSQNNSLYSELEMSSDNLDQIGRSNESIRSIRHPLSPHVSLHELDDDDIECDDDVHMASCTGNGFELEAVLEASQCVDVRHEYIESYRLVKSLLRKLRSPSVTSHPQQLPSPTDDPAEAVGGLLNMLQDVRELVEELRHKANSTYEEQYVLGLDERISELTLDLTATRNQLEKLRSIVREKDNELTQTSKQLDEMNRKLTLQHQEMMRIQKERDEYADRAYNRPESVVEQARKERDQAINKRNNMDMELASVRLELASTERQLMEAIHQKIAVSERLEQCEMDFESVLDFQMQKRFNTEVDLSPKRLDNKRENESHTKKLFSFLS